MHKIEVFIS